MSMSLVEDPIKYFDKLFKQACGEKDIKNPNAFNLATASKNAIPSNRILLLKDYSDQGFVFYSNMNSQKGTEIEENPFASMCFYWEKLSRQVRIEGKIVKVSSVEADDYFVSRPFGSCIGAWASKQSAILESRDLLLKRIDEYKSKFTLGNVPRPEFWIGYCLIPNKIEFWEEGDNRLHERVVYKLNEENNKWVHNLLYP